jgi:anti-sigma B factor antagonist
LKLSCEDYDQLSVMALNGELTAETVDPFQKLAKERIEKSTRDFVLDVTGMEFIDSRGLEALLWLQETVGENLGQVRLAAVQDNVRKILEMTRLAARFDAHPDVDSAIRSLR